MLWKSVERKGEGWETAPDSSIFGVALKISKATQRRELHRHLRLTCVCNRVPGRPALVQTPLLRLPEPCSQLGCQAQRISQLLGFWGCCPHPIAPLCFPNPTTPGSHPQHCRASSGGQRQGGRWHLHPRRAAGTPGTGPKVGTALVQFWDALTTRTGDSQGKKRGICG